jgi:hypothetical protein
MVAGEGIVHRSRCRLERRRMEDEAALSGFVEGRLVFVELRPNHVILRQNW